jgi:hypothetical protein
MARGGLSSFGKAAWQETRALKNPAEAGFKKIVLDQAAGVMLDACAPFGPWVNS